MLDSFVLCEPTPGEERRPASLTRVSSMTEGASAHQRSVPNPDGLLVRLTRQAKFGALSVPSGIDGTPSEFASRIGTDWWTSAGDSGVSEA